MKHFFAFVHDRDEEITKSSLCFKGFIDAFAENRLLNIFFSSISMRYGIPVDIVKHEFKFYLATTFCFQEARFAKKYRLAKLPSYFVKLVGFLGYTALFSKKAPKEAKKVDLMLLGIQSNLELDRFSNIAEQFSSKVAVTTHNPQNVSYENLNITGYRSRDRSTSFKLLISELAFGIPLALILSLVSRFNILCFNIYFLDKYLYFSTIFSEYAPQVTLQERHYDTSALLTYLLKQNGGKATASLQKNIIQIGYPCFYHYSDIIFSLGSENYELALQYGAKVTHIIPVGSYFMEKGYFSSTNLSQDLEEFDVLCLGGNSHPDHTLFLNTYNQYWPDYYEHFSWHTRLAEEYPNLKIGIKHRVNTKHDPYEHKLIDPSKVKYANPASNSYALAFKSKCVTTWCSTMGYELLSHNKSVLFADPGRRNLSFLPEGPLIDHWRPTTYESFRESVLKNLEKNDVPSVEVKDKLCYQSQNVSTAIKNELSNLIGLV